MSTHSDAARFSGALSDGRSASARPVEVSLAGSGLELLTPEGLPAGLWPYELLSSGVPLRAKAADGATLLVATHKSALLPIVDRLMVIQGGRVAIDGPRDLVLAKLSGSQNVTSLTSHKDGVAAANA